MSDCAISDNSCRERGKEVDDGLAGFEKRKKLNQLRSLERDPKVEI